MEHTSQAEPKQPHPGWLNHLTQSIPEAKWSHNKSEQRRSYPYAPTWHTTSRLEQTQENTA